MEIKSLVVKVKNEGWKIGCKEMLQHLDRQGKYGGWQIYAAWSFPANYDARLDEIVLVSGDRVICCSNCSTLSGSWFEFANGEFCENSHAVTAYVKKVIDFLGFCDSAYQSLEKKEANSLTIE